MPEAIRRTGTARNHDQAKEAPGPWDNSRQPGAHQAYGSQDGEDHDGESSLPASPVHNLVEGPAVEPGERPQRPAGRVAQTDHEHREVATGEPQHPLRLPLVGDRRVARADAEIGRRIGVRSGNALTSATCCGSPGRSSGRP
jgi:hypothetical protein